MAVNIFKVKGFDLFRVIPVTNLEIQKWSEKIALRISQPQKKEYARQ